MKTKQQAPTKEQIEQLAKLFMIGSTGEEDDWEELYLDETVVSVFDNDLALFEIHAENWREKSTPKEFNNGIFWERVQGLKGNERISIAVLDCGNFCLTYQQ